MIGPNADDLACLLGDYVPPLPPGVGTTVLAGLAQYAAVHHEPGCAITEPIKGGLVRAARAPRRRPTWPCSCSAAPANAATTTTSTATARGPAAAAVATAGEGFDVAEVQLPAAQLNLLDAVTATGTPTVAVVVAGRPHGIDRVADACAAVLYAWYPGPEGGQAIADLLLGGREPTGRLPVSLPRSSGVLPVAYNERVENTQSYVDFPAAPRFPFGAGLGYTTWRLGCPEVRGGAVTVSLCNTGKRCGTQVVQLYGRHRVTGVQPRRAILLGYQVVMAAAGEECAVRIVPECVAPGGDLDVWVSITGAAEPDQVVTYRSTR